MEQKNPRYKFPVGRILITPKAARSLSPGDIEHAIHRHLQGGWGDFNAKDSAANERGLRGDTRLLSAYRAWNGQRFWVITEADHSLTTVLLPQDY